MTTPQETFDSMLKRHDSERQALADALIQQEQLEARVLQQQFNANAGADLHAALQALEKQLRTDARNGTPIAATVVTELPSWVPAHLPHLDEEDALDGKKSVLVFMGRQSAHTGERERIALALFDCTDAVFGPSSR